MHAIPRQLAVWFWERVLAPSGMMRTRLVGVRSRCNGHQVTFNLESFALGIKARAAIWRTLGVVLQLKRISPNFGKPRGDGSVRVRYVD